MVNQHELGSSAAEMPLLHLEFCVRKTSSCQYYEQDGRVVVTRAKYSQFFDSTRLHYGVFSRAHEDAYSAISEVLDRLGVQPDDQSECINAVISKARELCDKNMRKADHTENYVLSTLDVCYEHLVHEGMQEEATEDQDRAMQDSVEEEEEEEQGMVPAALPAIRSLGATRIKVEEDGKDNVEQCVVCQEEYRNGEKVTCMPCLHMFHKDCITKWLLRSHLCPICKFQMPTYSS